MASRSLDQMIGYVGGVIGIILGAIGMLLHKLIASISIGESTTMLLFSLIGILGAFLVTSRKKDGGLMMIVIGVAGIIALPSYLTVIPFIILLIAGLIARL